MNSRSTLVTATARISKKAGWALFAFILLCGSIISQSAATDPPHIDADILKKAREQCGDDAPNRLVAWEELIRQETNKAEMDKLNKVNSFFNKLSYAEDIDLWGLKDHWATPIEFLCRGAGDCEDYAIAKYFTLKALGVLEEKLKITYVKALEQNRSHMVLAYYNHPGDEPLILDNLVDSIKPASQRTDLTPIFSFNGSGLWMAQQRNTSGIRLKKWDELMKKMSGHRPKK